MKNLTYFPFERNRYFYGKLLSVDDFETEQKYMNDKRRMINRFLHGCGVVCGLNVVLIDDSTISLETGLALDFSGREIVVDSPATKKLSLIEGFDSYSEADEDNRFLYLCIEYAEEGKDRVYNAAGGNSAPGSNAEYGRVAEGYRIYLTSEEPEDKNYNNDAHYEETRTVFWGNGIRISHVFPKYAVSGKELEFKVIIENMGQRQPIHVSYDLSLDCMVKNDNNVMHIEFDEERHEKSRRYEQVYTVSATAAKNVNACARVSAASFLLAIGGQRVTAAAREDMSTVRLIEGSIRREIQKRYYQEAMENIAKGTYQQGIYLARLSVIKAGSTYVIGGVENMPFRQYVYNNVISAVMDRITMDDIEKLSVRASAEGSGSQPPKEGMQPQGGRGELKTAAGTVTLDLGIGGMAGQRFFTGEIVHGLGLGPVHIVLGSAYGDQEESGVFYGDTDVFENESITVHASLAARADVTKGTFVIGLMLKETTVARTVQVHWMAVKDPQEGAEEDDNRSLCLKPDTMYLALRESYYFEPVFTGVSDTRVRFAVKDGEGGTIDENGMYTAPNIAGVFEVTAESIAYPELKASAFVAVRDMKQ